MSAPILGIPHSKQCAECQWPGCQMLAVVHRATRNAGGDLIGLCSAHRRTADYLGLTDMQRMAWKPKRWRYI